MKRINLYIEESDLKFLKKRSGTVSDHIRFAIENYIHNIKKEENKLNASESASREVEEWNR